MQSAECNTQEGDLVAKTMTQVDLEALDRLEQKVRLLVAEMGKLRTEHAKQVEENRRLAGELDDAVARLADAEAGAVEVAALRQERDQVRNRVAGILEQLEGLDI
jgi:regulator of replication initiation timing